MRRWAKKKDTIYLLTLIYSRQLSSIKSSIIDNSRIIFCLGWKSDTSLATQTKEIEARSDLVMNYE